LNGALKILVFAVVGTEVELLNGALKILVYAVVGTEVELGY